MEQISDHDPDLTDPFTVFMCILKHPAASKIARTLHTRIEHVRLAKQHRDNSPPRKPNGGADDDSGVAGVEVNAQDIVHSIGDVSRQILHLQRVHNLTYSSPKKVQRRRRSFGNVLGLQISLPAIGDGPGIEPARNKVISLPLLRSRQVHDCVERFYMTRIYGAVFRASDAHSESDRAYLQSAIAHKCVHMC